MLTQSLNEMNVAEDDVAAAAAAYSHQWLRAYGCVSRCCTSVWQDYFLHALFFIFFNVFFFFCFAWQSKIRVQHSQLNPLHKILRKHNQIKV